MLAPRKLVWTLPALFLASCAPSLAPSSDLADVATRDRDVSPAPTASPLSVDAPRPQICAVIERVPPPPSDAPRVGWEAPMGRRVPSMRRAEHLCCYTSPDTIRAWLRPAREGAARCYERALVRRPALRGRFAVHFELAPSGLMTSVCEVSAGSPDAIDDPELARCVVESFAAVESPADEACGVRKITYPMQFEPGQ